MTPRARSRPGRRSWRGRPSARRGGRPRRRGRRARTRGAAGTSAGTPAKSGGSSLALNLALASSVSRGVAALLGGRRHDGALLVHGQDDGPVAEARLEGGDLLLRHRADAHGQEGQVVELAEGHGDVRQGPRLVEGLADPRSYARRSCAGPTRDRPRGRPCSRRAAPRWRRAAWRRRGSRSERANPARPGWPRAARWRRRRAWAPARSRRPGARPGASPRSSPPSARRGLDDRRPLFRDELEALRLADRLEDGIDVPLEHVQLELAHGNRAHADPPVRPAAKEAISSTGAPRWTPSMMPMIAAVSYSLILK